MNKIVLQFGLLVFFLSLIFFSQTGISIEQTLLRAFVIFIVVTGMLGVLTLTFIRAINKSAAEPKDHKFDDNFLGNNNE